jgi:hypothetical protein
MIDFPSVEAVSHHPHMSYTERLEIDRLEEVIMKSYRQCQKKEARTDILGVNSDHQCSACHHSMFIYAQSVNETNTSLRVSTKYNDDMSGM